MRGSFTVTLRHYKDPAFEMSQRREDRDAVKTLPQQVCSCETLLCPSTKDIELSQ